jgi:hypothetical protein
MPRWFFPHSFVVRCQNWRHNRTPKYVHASLWSLSETVRWIRRFRLSVDKRMRNMRIADANDACRSMNHIKHVLRTGYSFIHQPVRRRPVFVHRIGRCPLSKYQPKNNTFRDRIKSLQESAVHGFLTTREAVYRHHDTCRVRPCTTRCDVTDTTRKQISSASRNTRHRRVDFRLTRDFVLSAKHRLFDVERFDFSSSALASDNV